MACLHEGGGPQVGEVTRGGSLHLSCKRDQIKIRDYMDRRVTPPKRVTSPTWGPPPPCKQALRRLLPFKYFSRVLGLKYLYKKYTTKSLAIQRSCDRGQELVNKLKISRVEKRKL